MPWQRDCTPDRAEGDRVLLVYPPGLDFVAAMLGCFMAGAVAVPAIPEPSARAMTRFRKVVADAQATLVLSTEALIGMVQYMLAHARSYSVCNGSPPTRRDMSPGRAVLYTAEPT